MKKCILLIILILSPSLAYNASAQFASTEIHNIEHSHFWYPNMDMQIMQIRANAFPNVRFHADDYIQYSPAVIMLLTKACGYQSKSSWGRMLTADAFSVGLMAIGVNGLKYSLRRMRPNESRRNSFPSGHTTTAFTLATMLHKEYGWRSPWFSIGGYTIASSVAIMRLVNNMHWMSDTIVGALLGIGATHLGYYLSDLIFKEKGINSNYEKEEYFYDKGKRMYEMELMFSKRFVLGNNQLKKSGILPKQGANVSINAYIPIIPRIGVMARLGAGSMENTNVYNTIAGIYYNYPFGKRFQTEAHVMAGYARLTCKDSNRADLVAGGSFAISFAPCFKVRAYAEYENISSARGSIGIDSILLGFASSFYF